MDILICANSLEIGGAERALVGLLTQLNTPTCNVDLFLNRQTGAFMKHIPEYINLLPEDPNAACIAIPVIDALKSRAFGVVLGRTFAKVAARRYVKRHRLANNNVAIEYSHLYTYPFVKQINPNKCYDIVIAFHEPHYIAAYRTTAKKKIAWMHTDYQAIGVNAIEGLRLWSQFDGIVAISEDCATHFKARYPSLASKVVLIENILPKKLILDDADAFYIEAEMPKYSGVNLLSIGRYCTAKNFDNVPDICRRLLALGADIRWYLIGYGGDEQLIEQRIIENGVEGRVILLGQNDNPYPYIKSCDLYVQPSRYEGKSVTVREAQLLGKPVVITAYPTSHSQLTEGIDGVIVPLDNQGCAEGIFRLLQTPQRMAALGNACRHRDYSGVDNMQRLFQLMEPEL